MLFPKTLRPLLPVSVISRNFPCSCTLASFAKVVQKKPLETSKAQLNKDKFICRRNIVDALTLPPGFAVFDSKQNIQIHALFKKKL